MEEADIEIRWSGGKLSSCTQESEDLIQLRLTGLHDSQPAARRYCDIPNPQHDDCDTSFAECKHQTGETYSRMGMTIAL